MDEKLEKARIVILTEDRRKRLLEIADELKELLAFLGDDPIRLAVPVEDQQDLQSGGGEMNDRAEAEK